MRSSVEELWRTGDGCRCRRKLPFEVVAGDKISSGVAVKKLAGGLEVLNSTSEFEKLCSRCWVERVYAGFDNKKWEI